MFSWYCILFILIFEKITDKFNDHFIRYGLKKYIDKSNNAITSKFYTLKVLLYFVLLLSFIYDGFLLETQSFYLLSCVQIIILSSLLWFNSNKYDQKIELIDSDARIHNLYLSKFVSCNGLFLIYTNYLYNTLIFNNNLIISLIVNIFYMINLFIILYPKGLFYHVNNSFSYEISMYRKYWIFQIILCVILLIPLILHLYIKLILKLKV